MKKPTSKPRVRQRAKKPSLKPVHKGEHLINGIDPYDFKKEKVGINNLYSKKIPWSSCVYVQFLFHSGSMHDPVGKEGLAHFTEHMIFAGTPTHPNKLAISEFEKAYTLDSLNAFTSFNNICVHFRCLPEHLADALAGVTEMITAPLLRESDVLQERDIITQEAWARFKNQQSIEYKKREVKNIFKSFPDRIRGPSPLGWPETIAQITRGDVLEFSKTHFVRENLEVLLAGNIQPTHTQLIKDVVKKIPHGKKSKKVLIPKQIAAPENPFWINTYSEMGMAPSKQAYLEISSAEPVRMRNKNTGIETVSRALVHDLLYKKMRHEQSWCYGVGVSFGNSVDFLGGEINSKIDPEKVHTAIDTMESVLTDIVNGKHEKEFDKEKTLVIDRKRAVELTSGDIVEAGLHSARHLEELQTRKQAFANLYAVTYADVRKYVKRTLLDSPTKLYEIQVPDDYDKEKTIEFLKMRLKTRKRV